MKRTLKAVEILVGCSLGLYLSLSFVAVVSGNFSWNRLFAFGIGVGALGMVLVTANALRRFKQEHRRGYGLIQLFVGSAILMTQLSASGASDAGHTVFVTKLLAALFFFAQGIENRKSGRRIQA
jgi:hypothetical protein